MSFYVLAGFLYGNALTLAFGLFPRKFRSNNERSPNDGLLLFTVPFHVSQVDGNVAFIRPSIMRQWSHWSEATFKTQSTGWRRVWRLILTIHGRWFKASILSHRHGYAVRARELYLRALSNLNRHRNSKHISGIASHGSILMIATPPLLEEADQFSWQALEDSLANPTPEEREAVVLIELGRIDEGLPLVEQALREHDKASDKALNACYLAIAMIGRGDVVNGGKYIGKAEEYDPNCPLLERATKRLNER